MTQISFYHLIHLPLEKALPKLLEKAMAAGLRAVVRAGSAERVAMLDEVLWTYEKDSWLPHGTARLGQPEHNPIWLTDHDENPNQAQLLVLTDGATSAHIAGFTRCLDLFDGKDDAATSAARQRWKAAKEAGFELVYYQQTETGGWEAKFRT